MGVAVLFLFALYMSLGLLVISLLIRFRRHPIWFLLAFVFWGLLPQFYWGAYTLKDYLVFRKECRKLEDQFNRQIPDFGVPLVEGGTPSSEDWIRSVVSAAYGQGRDGYFLREWKDVPQSACPDVRRGDALYQAFNPKEGCYTFRQVDQIEAKYRIRFERSALAAPLSSYTKAFRHDYIVESIDTVDHPPVSEWSQMNLWREIPWNFLLVPGRSQLASCGTNGIDGRQWLETLVHGDQ